jgi:isoquinoline 1-oxidoreductase subunit beta
MPTWVVCVGRVRLDRATGVVSAEKLTIVINPGTIVEPDSARTEFVEGWARETNLDTYSPLTVDVPEIGHLRCGGSPASKPPIRHGRASSP